LVDIGRKLVEERVGRPFGQRLERGAMAAVFPRTNLFRALMRLGMLARPVLPATLADKLPAGIPDRGKWPAPRHARRMVALAGCVQPALTPDTNAAAARVLDRLGISLVEAPGVGCCGALRFHLNYQARGLDDMRRVIDAWWPYVEEGVEAFAMTATGCGATVREYGDHLQHDSRYAEKARRVSEMTRDLAEVVAGELDRLTPLLPRPTLRKVAFHPPCSMQHWQKLRGVAEKILSRLGYELTHVPDAHSCCGSAGTYALTQPELAGKLKQAKLAALQSGTPELILTANVGCQTHLAGEAKVPVKHWIVELDDRLTGA
jgi:glycolate oxidase iron-sulfur subunit